MKKKILALATVVTLSGIGFGQERISQDVLYIGTDSNTSTIKFDTEGADPSIMYDNTKKSFIINSKYQEDITFTDGGNQENFIIKGDTGNVGIGTATPRELLEVRGAIMIPRATTVDNDSPGLVYINNDDFLYDGEYLNHYGFGFHAYDQEIPNNTISKTNTYVSGYFGVDLFTGGQNRFRIKSNGNVGIGTTSPDEKLTVKGKIHAEEVRVDLSVPADYVFEKYYTGESKLKADYTMPTLEEVEAFTKINNHLPDVPSAKQIQEEGLHLKEMTNLLLQKVEELTLYTIEQQKQLKAQQKEIELLKEKVQNQ